jgi:hypothetical protein
MDCDGPSNNNSHRARMLRSSGKFKPIDLDYDNGSTYTPSGVAAIFDESQILLVLMHALATTSVLALTVAHRKSVVVSKIRTTNFLC